MIYLDYNATTPTDPKVVTAMHPFFTEHFGNAASNHPQGWQAAEAVELARSQVARLLNAKQSANIIFTSGATESNNFALFGCARARKHLGRHIISQVTEHESVLQPLEALRDEGFEITLLPVDQRGTISVDHLRGAMRPDTILVSIMAANNEIGAIQPTANIGALCAQKNIPFHCDGVQAIGKIPFDVQHAQVTLLSLSGHKMYGPKGCGILYIAEQTPPLRLQPLLYGGGHERGLRSGTLATPLIVGMGRAAQLVCEEGAEEIKFYEMLKKTLVHGLKEIFPKIIINGGVENTLPNTLNVSFPGVSNDVLLGLLSSIALSFGSACGSQKSSVSHVLRALGVTEPMAHSTLRLSLGRFTRLEDITATLDCFRKLQP